MCVQVDEPRRDGQPRGVDLAGGRRADQVTDRGDPLAVDGRVGGPPGRARAVDDSPVADDQIVRHRAAPCGVLRWRW